MTNFRLRYVKSYIDRHGKVRHDVRRPGPQTGPVARSAGSDEYGEPMARRSRLSTHPRSATRTLAGTVTAITVGYLGSATFYNLAPASQPQYRRILEGLRHEFGNRRLATLERGHVVTCSAPRPRRRSPPVTCCAASAPGPTPSASASGRRSDRRRAREASQE